MSRSKEIRKKVDVARPSAPLQANPFAVLGEVEALKNLVPEKPPVKSPERVAVAAKAAAVVPRRGRLILRRETKGRGGKTVVVVYGFNELPGASAVMIGNLAHELKGKLGCGGSFDRQEIVLQGDRCAAVCALLEQIGFQVAGVRE